MTSVDERARRLAEAIAAESLPELLEQFTPVHRGLASGDVSDDAWGELAERLPSIGWWRSWDRCERLRRAAIGVVARRGGCLGGLLRDADAATVQYVVRSCLATVDGNRLLNALILKESENPSWKDSRRTEAS